MSILQKAKDVVLHAKNKVTGVGTEVKVIYPTTRWENILGAPRLLTSDTIEKSFPSEYALYSYGDLTISDEEYEACFGNVFEE